MMMIIKLMKYVIFDVSTHTGSYEDRMQWLKKNILRNDPNCFATVVEIKKCQGQAHLQECLIVGRKSSRERSILRQLGSQHENLT